MAPTYFLGSDGPAGFDEGSIFFVGNATVILRYAGFTILTDPNFLHAGDHVHLGYGLTARRLTNPAIELHELPDIDLVVLSHLHEDHFDRVVAKQLDPMLPIATTVQAAKRLRQMGFRHTIPVAHWQSVRFEKGTARLTLTGMPGRHGPGPLAKLLPPVMGSLLEFAPADVDTTFRLYVSGDTLVHEDLREIPKRVQPPIDVALLHLGGTRVLGIYVTMDGRQGVELIRILQPNRVIPIHFDDYSRFKSPLSDFAKEADAAGFSNRVHYLMRGETYAFRIPAHRLRPEHLTLRRPEEAALDARAPIDPLPPR